MGMTPTQYENAKRMWAEGYSTIYIADSMGMSRTTIASCVNRHRDDFPRRQHSTMTAEDVRLMRALRVAYGWDDQRIAAEIGCAPITVHRHLKETR